MKKVIHKTLVLFLLVTLIMTNFNYGTVYATQVGNGTNELPDAEQSGRTSTSGANVDDIDTGTGDEAVNVKGSGTNGTKTEDENADGDSTKNTDANAAEEQSSIIDAILNTDINTVKANKNIPEIPSTSYQKYFSFETTRPMKGIVGNTSFYFNMPNYWDAKFVYVGIAYEVSSLVTDDVPASLTFLVNDVPVYSCFIEYDKGKEQTAYFTIPVDKLKEGFNLLYISSYVRIYDSEGCTEDQSLSNWVNIKDSSYVYAGYDLLDDDKISYYPYPFISTVNPTGEHTGIIVPDNALNGELAAAAYLLADISTSTTDQNEISLCQYKDVVGKGITKKVLISTTANLPAEFNKYLQVNLAENSLAAETYVLSDRTMIRLVKDVSDNPLLLIVSDKENNLMEAVHMLLDEDRISQEKGNIAFVQEGSAQIVYDSRQLSQLVAGSYTIDNLMGKGMTYVGPFHNEQIIYLPFGNDYVLSSDGKISLKFRYSENLDFDRSLITVFWGDVPIASKKLTKENAAADELTFTMPSDVIGTNSSSIKIAFDLEIKDLLCTMRQDQMPWAYVTSDSMLYLPAKDNNVVSFDYFPSPFQKKGMFDNVLLVVGDDLKEQDLELLGKAVSVYGYQVEPYGTLKVIRASEFSETDADYNIITAGTLQNSFLAKINSNLHFQLNSAGDAFVSNSKLVLSEQYAKSIASFQLIESPFAKDRTIFAAVSTGKDSTAVAQGFLQDNEERWNLEGDCVLVDSDNDLKSFVFLETKEVEEKPSIGEFVEENKQTVLFTIMSAAAMIMLLTISILILSRAKQYKRKEDDES
ncbi:MAG: cellulose biosynthesis cyclic di-GMP-binding regulatory protein BcsB [Mobilitalea sp.]